MLYNKEKTARQKVLKHKNIQEGSGEIMKDVLKDLLKNPDLLIETGKKQSASITINLKNEKGIIWTKVFSEKRV